LIAMIAKVIIFVFFCQEIYFKNRHRFGTNLESQDMVLKKYFLFNSRFSLTFQNLLVYDECVWLKGKVWRPQKLEIEPKEALVR